jgi:hypothetical protein
MAIDVRTSRWLEGRTSLAGRAASLTPLVRRATSTTPTGRDGNESHRSSCCTHRPQGPVPSNGKQSGPRIGIEKGPLTGLGAGLRCQQAVCCSAYRTYLPINPQIRRTVTPDTREALPRYEMQTYLFCREATPAAACSNTLPTIRSTDLTQTNCPR